MVQRFYYLFKLINANNANKLKTPVLHQYISNYFYSIQIFYKQIIIISVWDSVLKLLLLGVISTEAPYKNYEFHRRIFL